jgi:replication factor C subunit 2/4
MSKNINSKKVVIPKPQITNNTTLNVPWIEKYRPYTIDELVVDRGTHNKIKKIIDDKDMPNIIITGLPGIGKTTTILCIAKNLLGKYFREGCIELNASDDRGIKAVQDSIIYFCKKKLEMDSTEDRKYAKHKIVLLDEADNMTKKAQQLINNLMEKHHNTTRFAFTCNNSSEIIEAIQSRCIIFRYQRLSNEQVITRLKVICEKENIEYDDEGMNALILTAQGDLRKAINNLQLIYNGYEIINEENVYRLCDRPHPMIIQNIFVACNDRNVKEALQLLEQLKADGFSSSDISISMIDTIKTTKMELDEATKIKFLYEVCKTCLIINRGVSSYLQLTGCIAKLCM